MNIAESQIRHRVLLQFPVFVTDKGIRVENFLEYGGTATAFGQTVGTPSQEGTPVILGGFGGASVGPTLTNATSAGQIEGTFQSMGAAVGPAGLNIQTSPEITSVTPSVGKGTAFGGWGNVTTNTVRLPTRSPIEALINSIPKRP